MKYALKIDKNRSEETRYEPVVGSQPNHVFVSLYKHVNIFKNMYANISTHVYLFICRYVRVYTYKHIHM